MNTISIVVALLLAWCLIAGILVIAASCQSARFSDECRENESRE